MKRMIYIVGMLLGLYACQSNEPKADVNTGQHVYLAARIEQPRVQSRVPYELTNPSLNNPLKVDVWASTDATKFANENQNGSDGTVAYHTSARFTNGTEQLLNDVIYPEQDGKPVHFVGMHPIGWTTTDGTSATYVFDGNDDVMFAPHIFGVYGGNTTGEKWPTLIFKHLLTWLRVEMVAESEAVSEAWGEVKNIQIKSRNKVTVDLDKVYPAEKIHDNVDASVQFSGDEVLDFYQTGTDALFSTKTVKTLRYPESAKEEVAYVLCAPVYASATDNEYTIVITTEKRTMEMEIDLMKGKDEPFTETTMGHQFTLLLRFKMGDNISVSATTTDWVNGGMESTDFGENDIK